MIERMKNKWVISYFEESFNYETIWNGESAL